MQAVRYLLDTNVYIDAKNHYYAFDIVPSFWKFLEDYATRGLVFSIDRILDELKLFKVTDPLCNWACTKCKHGFLDTTEPDVVRAYGDLQKWANMQPQFTGGALQQFGSNADAWLVAYAWIHGMTVVTHEKLRPAAQKEVQIPNVCQAFSVPSCNPFDMLRALKIRF